MYGRMNIFRKTKEKAVKTVKKEVVKETKKSVKRYLPMVKKAAAVGLAIVSILLGVATKGLPGPTTASVINIYNGPVTMIHA